MLSKTKGVISKYLGLIKQYSKIELEQIKPDVNFYLIFLLDYLYILNQYINFNFKTIYKHQIITIKRIFLRKKYDCNGYYLKIDIPII